MKRLLPVLIVSCMTWSAQPGGAQTRNSRLFPPLDLGLLEGPDRDEWQKPDQIMDALVIADGAVVADLGCGAGWFTVRLARRVGPNGLVYAEDVQTEMIGATVRRVQREGLRNVKPILGTQDDPKLPAGRVDAVLIVGIYHEIANPVTLLKNVGRALKVTGRVGIVDFTRGDGGPGPPGEERVDPAVILRDAQRAGLRFLKQESFLPFQYLLIFGK
jgi:SAM-dependent methyltransferase